MAAAERPIPPLERQALGSKGRALSAGQRCGGLLWPRSLTCRVAEEESGWRAGTGKRLGRKGLPWSRRGDLPMQQLLNSGRSSPQPAGYRIDLSRGERIGRVSSEWWSRPADERYLSLTDLHRAVKARADRSRARTLDSREIRVEASRNNPDRLALVLPGEPEPVAPTHWSFRQLASLVGAPAGYLRQLPAPIAGINLQYGFAHPRSEMVKTYTTDDGRPELRAVTGPDYGRIHDHELVEALMRIAGNGTGDTRWKAPGVLDWRTMTYNPRVDVTAETTTFYASDRDVFVFLVDDLNPIEAGRLPGVCRTARPISTFEASMCGTRRWAAARLASRASSCARFVRTERFTA